MTENGVGVGGKGESGYRLGKISTLDLSCYLAESFWICLFVSALQIPLF